MITLQHIALCCKVIIVYTNFILEQMKMNYICD